jgi:NitT/TauT family transport system substrate-binding protein
MFLCRWFASLIALAFVLGSQPALCAPTKVAVGYAVSADMIALFVAEQEGMFVRHGLDVTPIPLTLASVGPAGLISGSLQISMANPTILLNAVSGGLDLVAIAGASRHLKDNENTSLVARAGSGIKTAADLKGKRVGIPGFGSTNDLTFRKWLKNNHVDVGDVTLIEARLPDMKDLLRSKSLDAVAVLEPMRSRITEDATGYWVADFVTDVRNGLNGAIWIASRDWAADNRGSVEAYRAALSEALDFIKTQPDQARAIEIKYLKVASPTRPYLAMDLSAEDLKFFEDIMLEMGALQQPVDVSKLIFR